MSTHVPIAELRDMMDKGEVRVTEWISRYGRLTVNIVRPNMPSGKVGRVQTWRVV